MFDTDENIKLIQEIRGLMIAKSESTNSDEIAYFDNKIKELGYELQKLVNQHSNYPKE